MRYGLTDESINEIHTALQRVPSVLQAILYGSRAKGNFTEGSDIDLAIKGNLSFDDLSKVSAMLDDSNLPYTFDLSIYNNINNEALLDHIDRVGIVFYQKRE